VGDLRQRIEQLRRENFGRKVTKGEEVWIAGYSDASYKNDEPFRGSSWGLWVRDAHHRHLRAGPCPDWVMGAGSTYAELMAVHQAVITGLPLEGNIMVVKTDCQSVVQWFGWGREGGGYPKHPQGQELVIHTLEQAAAREVRLIVKWVPGHKERKSTQGYLNDRVDRMARTAREQHRLIEWSCAIGDERSHEQPGPHPSDAAPAPESAAPHARGCDPGAGPPERRDGRPGRSRHRR